MSETDDPVQVMEDEVKRIHSVAYRILETLHLSKFSPLFRHSVLTTAFVNNMKQIMRDTPPEYFEENKGTMLSLLTQISKDIAEMQPSESQSPTAQNPTRQDGTVN